MDKQSAWEASGNSGRAPEGWYGPGGSKENPNYGGGGGGGSETDDYLRSVVEGYQKQLEQYNSRFSEYTNKNPFVFDKVLAEESAKVKQRLDPYYNQVLGDFLQGTKIKTERSLEDERTLVNQLTQSTDQYNREQKDVLRNSLDKIDQGAALSNTVESGLASREQGNLLADTQQGLESYNTAQDSKLKQAQLEGSRYRDYDIPLSEKIQKRDVGEEQRYQTQAQALGQTSQRQNQFQFARQEYAGNPAGTNPVQFQNNLYSILGT